MHLTGDGLEVEMRQAKLNVAKTWKDKMVVDTLHFRPHFGAGYTRAGAEQSALPHGQAAQLDKTKDILDGRARKKGIKVRALVIGLGGWTMGRTNQSIKPHHISYLPVVRSLCCLLTRLLRPHRPMAHRPMAHRPMAHRFTTGRAAKPLAEWGAHKAQNSAVCDDLQRTGWAAI